MIDWSQAPEGATHFCETSGCAEFGKQENGVWFFARPGGEWVECAWQNHVNFTRDDAVVRPTVTTPTLETMLAEWRDLQARAQAAQAEADALFEHAGQCHGEIVVRLAELGWGVPGEPVVALDTPLDMTDWHNWQVGDLIRVVNNEGYDNLISTGNEYSVVTVDDGYPDLTSLRIAISDHEVWLDRDHMLWISRPSAQQ